jgi:lipopolysaccharide export system protein LptA
MSCHPNRPRPEGLIQRLLAGLALVAAMLTAPLATALPEDRDQPIRIEADEALRDEKQGFTRYKGNVKMDQGSLHIEADEVTVYHVDQEADKIVARGKPAQMQQRPEPEKGLMKARAETIEYYKNDDRVQLLNNASIEQDGSTVTGDSIEYFISEQRVRADSDRSREDSRVQVVIPAQAIENQNQDSDSGATDSE